MTDIHNFIATPNMAFLLLVFGIYGIFLETVNPGAVMPALFGVICFGLALIGFNSLPVNSSGAWFLLIGFALIAGEAILPTFGLLALTGALTFATGGTKIIDKEVYGSGVSMWVIIPITLTTLAVIIYTMNLLLKSRKAPITTGVEGLINSHGKIESWAQGKGEIIAAGSHWQAVSEKDYLFNKGTEVKIIKVEGLKLIIEPLDKQEKKL